MAAETRIVYLNPRDLLPSRRNVRSDPGDLAGLAETIREHGILQPLGVAREGEDYRIVYGNRRREAAIVVGLDRVPCMVIQAPSDEDVVVQQVLENLQRLDLNDLDKSRAFEQLLEQMMGDGHEQGQALDMMARTLGLSTRQVQRYLRLRQLAPRVQRLMAQGELGVTHGQHLADIVPMSRQEAVAELAVQEGLSAAELSRLCAALKHNPNIEPTQALGMLRRGERIVAIEQRPRESVHLYGGSPAPRDAEVVGEDDEQGRSPEEGSAGSSRDALGRAFEDEAHYTRLEPTTRDGNRVRKIHSLDAFMDEVQRLAHCVQEGDLQRLMEEDEASALKLRLAERQLRFLLEAIAALRKASEATG